MVSSPSPRRRSRRSSPSRTSSRRRERSRSRSRDRRRRRSRSPRSSRRRSRSRGSPSPDTVKRRRRRDAAAVRDLMASVDARLTALAARHGFGSAPAAMDDDERRAFCVALSASVTPAPDFADWWRNGVEKRARERAADAWRRECEEREARGPSPRPFEKTKGKKDGEPPAQPAVAAPAAAPAAAPTERRATPPPEAGDAWQTVRVVDGDPCASVRPAGSLYELAYVRTQVARAAAKAAAAAEAAAKAGGSPSVNPPPRSGRAGAPLVPWMSVRRPEDGLWLPAGDAAIDPAHLEWLPARADRDAARAAAADGAPAFGPPPPPHVTAALRAALVDAVLGGRAARAFCARVVGRAVERAVAEKKDG